MQQIFIDNIPYIRHFGYQDKWVSSKSFPRELQPHWSSESSWNMQVLSFHRAFEYCPGPLFSPPTIPSAIPTTSSLHGHSCYPSDLSFCYTEKPSSPTFHSQSQHPVCFFHSTWDTLKWFYLFHCKSGLCQPLLLAYKFHGGKDQVFLVCHYILSIWHKTDAQQIVIELN